MVHDVHELQRRAKRTGQPSCDPGGQERRLGRVERAEDRLRSHCRFPPLRDPRDRNGAAGQAREEMDRASSCARPDGRTTVKPLRGGVLAWAAVAVRVRRVRGLPRGVARRRRERRRRVGADARPAARPRARRARRAVRAAGDRASAPSCSPTARPTCRCTSSTSGRPATRGAAVLAVDGAVHGVDGRAGVRARPDPAVRLLRPDRGRVVLPDRLRPRPARGARRGADGAAGHRRQRGRAADRRRAALRRVRHVLAARAVRARRRPARRPRSPAR